MLRLQTKFRPRKSSLNSPATANNNNNNNDIDSPITPATPSMSAPPPIEIARMMPLEFNVYSGSSRVKPGSGSSGSTEKAATDGSDIYFLGPHRKDRLFAITDRHNSLRCRPSPFLILHDGLARTSAGLGSATNIYVDGGSRGASGGSGSWKEGASGRIEGKGDGGVEAGRGFWDEYSVSVVAPGMGKDGGDLFVKEKLVAVNFWVEEVKDVAMRFGMERVLARAPVWDEEEKEGESRKKETREGRTEFEWRPDYGPGVLHRTEETRLEGWKLVARKRPNEVLAVCVPNRNSWTKLFRFGFCGRGRDASKYSVTWELMAIMTGMTVCHRMTEIGHSVG